MPDASAPEATGGMSHWRSVSGVSVTTFQINFSAGQGRLNQGAANTGVDTRLSTPARPEAVSMRHRPTCRLPANVKGSHVLGLLKVRAGRRGKTTGTVLPFTSHCNTVSNRCLVG